MTIPLLFLTTFLKTPKINGLCFKLVLKSKRNMMPSIIHLNNIVRKNILLVGSSHKIYLCEDQEPVSSNQGYWDQVGF